MPGSRVADDLLGFVRGNRPLAALEAAGIEVKTSPRFEATFPAGLPTVSASLADLATGFLAVLPDPHASRVWAFVLMASDVQLPDPEQSAEADTLNSALWDLSFGNEPSAEQLALIKALTAAPTEHAGLKPLDLRRLRRELIRQLDRAEQIFGPTVQLDYDYYWQLDPGDVVDPYATPEPTLGQISDDLVELEGMAGRSDDDLVLWHDLSHLTGLLNALASADTSR